MKISYQDAVTFPFTRQEFLDHVNFKDYGIYVKRVSYEPLHANQRVIRPKMATLPSPLALFFGKTRTRSTIYVFPRAFNDEDTEDDFISNLIEHEGEHARENYESPTSLWRLILKGRAKIKDASIQAEKRAFLNQMRKSKGRNHSQGHMTSLLAGINTGIS